MNVLIAGLALLALKVVLDIIDWPPVYGGVPYTKFRHQLYEWLPFLGGPLVIGGLYLAC